MDFIRTHLACGFPRDWAADLAQYCRHIAHGPFGQPVREAGFRPYDSWYATVQGAGWSVLLRMKPTVPALPPLAKIPLDK